LISNNRKEVARDEAPGWFFNLIENARKCKKSTKNN
jgi:hypothetical protein